MENPTRKSWEKGKKGKVNGKELKAGKNKVKSPRYNVEQFYG